MEPQKLKRIVIKEEFVAITGNYIDAILLSQLLYWSERVRDFDLFIKQEQIENKIEPKYGWIYKSYVELSNETMIGLSPSNVKKHLEKLIELGFISTRQNKNKWDRRKEYKINLIAIQNELLKNGYALDGYALILPFSKTENGSSNIENGVSKIENRNAQNRKTVTETTTETTTNNSMSEKISDAKFDENSDEIKIVNYFIEKLKGVNKNIKVPNSLKNKQKWATEIHRLIKIDGKNREEVCKVIAFATKDDFWCSNILSPASLRKHFDRLNIKMQKNKYSYNNVSETEAITETEKMLEQRRREREEMYANE